jgi:hypothetical protein
MIGIVFRQFRRLFGALRNAPSERAEDSDKWRELAERKKRLDALAAEHQARRSARPDAGPPEG